MSLVRFQKNLNIILNDTVHPNQIRIMRKFGVEFFVISERPLPIRWEAIEEIVLPEDIQFSFHFYSNFLDY